MVYLAAAIGLMVVLPAISVIVELLMVQGSDLLMLIGKWFTFWGIGVRLFTAGLSQALRPSFTATEIFHATEPEAEKLVAEIGFANLGIGLIALISLILPGWLTPAAIAGGVFLGLDGIKHITNTGRSGNENLALATDLVVTAAVVLYLIGLVV